MQIKNKQNLKINSYLQKNQNYNDFFGVIVHIKII